VVEEAEEAPTCALEALVLAGAVGRKVKARSNQRERAERWRDESDESDDVAVSRELEAFFARVARGETEQGLAELGKESVALESVTFEQLCDALESVEVPDRSHVLLAFAPRCRVRRGDFASALPPLPRFGRRAAEALLEIAECGTRLFEIERRSDAATAAAVSLAAAGDVEGASDANLVAHECDARAHDVAHSGLLSSALIDALADAVQHKRCARDVRQVAADARKRVATCAANKRVAASADSDLRTALDVDVPDEARERARQWRSDIDSLARANHAALCDAAKTPTDQIAFEEVASTKRIALTLAAVVRARTGEKTSGDTKPRLAPIGTRRILHPDD